MPQSTPQRETREQCKARWNALLQPLIGRRIVGARYMSDAETEAHGWSRAPLLLCLDDKTIIYASSDDEGNDAGALFIMPSPSAKAAGLPEGAPVI